MGKKTGDRVYWNDPDNGILSGYYIIKSVVDSDTLILTDISGDSDIWVFINEIQG